MLKYTQEDLQKIAGFVSAEKAMLRYVRPSIVLSILGGIYCLVMSIMCIWGALQGVLSGTSLFTYFILLFIGVLLGCITFMPLLEYREMLKFLKNNNIYHEAVGDFSSAQPFLYDRVRLGNKFVFGKRYCAILRYTDIRKVYQHVFRRNFVERERELHIVDTSGKIRHLCKLKVHHEWQSRKNNLLDEQLLEVLSLMLSKNRRITVGY